MNIFASLAQQRLLLSAAMLAPLAMLVPAAAMASLAAPAPAGPSAGGPSAAPVPYERQQVIALAEKVADYQLQLYAGGPASSGLAAESFKETGWIQGALFVGLRDLADRSADAKYRNAILARGQFTAWKTGSRAYHADDHVIGQAYLWAATHGAGQEAIGPLRARFDQILAAPPTGVGLQHGDRGDTNIPDCKKRWCWADALFMAPPAWFELSTLTGDPKYADYARKEFIAVTDYLYDKDEHLYYRDSRFFERRGPNGEKVFWSRGAGWVYAGLARIIPLLARDDPFRARLEGIFRDMSARLVKLQKPDGYWSPSLLADPATTRPETSGTGFFTYGLAWGIQAGLLDRAAYEPAVRKGWTALVRAVHPDGRFGYVQPVGDRPDNVSYNDTQFYGGGAFLLAATAVADLKLAPGVDLTVQATVQHPQMVLNVRTDDPSGKHYRQRNRYTVHAEHRIGDGSIAFEGLGWESNVAAYRLYLDERMAIDIFGKKAPANILHTVGLGGDTYHKMAAWGMDIFKVGDGVGIGGIGRLRGGKAVQLGKSAISVALDNTNPQEASAEIRNRGLDGGDAELTTRLAIRGDSALTRVSAKAAGAGQADASFVTGLAVHPGVTVLQDGADSNGWAFIATWGRQSLAKDDLGIAVFYRPDAVAGMPVNDGATLYIAFRNPDSIGYAFGAAWAQDQQGIRSLPEFRSWLDKRRYELAGK